MNRELAERVIEQTKKIDAALGPIADMASEITDEAERKKIIRAFGERV